MLYRRDRGGNAVFIQSIKTILSGKKPEPSGSRGRAGPLTKVAKKDQERRLTTDQAALSKARRARGDCKELGNY